MLAGISAAVGTRRLGQRGSMYTITLAESHSNYLPPSKPEGSALIHSRNMALREIAWQMSLDPRIHLSRSAAEHGHMMHGARVSGIDNTMES